MLSATSAASSDDYFHGSAASEDFDGEEGVPRPAPVSLHTLAQEVVVALRAAGVRGSLRDPRRDAPGGKSDFATAPVVQVKLADGSIPTMLRAQKALRAFAWHEGRPARTLYVSRPPASLAEELRLALSAQDLIDDWDFRLEATGTDAETVRVRLVAHVASPLARRGLLDTARATLRSYAIASGEDPMALLVTRRPVSLADA